MSSQPGCNSFSPNPVFAQRGSLSVQCVTVDDFLGGRGVDVVKIDVEGAEIAVLEGMRQTLQKGSNIRRMICQDEPSLLEGWGAESFGTNLSFEREWVFDSAD